MAHNEKGNPETGDSAGGRKIKMFTNQSLVTALFGSILGATAAATLTFAIAGSLTDDAPSGHSVEVTYSVNGTNAADDDGTPTYPDDSGWD
jgi:hypothetical protein